MNLSAVSNLPTPMKVGAAVVGGAGLLSIVRLVGGPQVVILLASGLVVVALVTVAYKKFMKWRAKAKAAPLMSKVTENAKAAPQQVADAAGRARLDELRKKFESGITEFRKAGKDIYTLPWYMLIGEPGSGKTEAIRHAQLPFPQGMNDPLQGSGGTVNMDWWFTNKAVMLDTAGRFVFEQVEAGSTGEWKEFLRLLRTYRRDCPINGLVLVIPADSLIKDTAEVIERKAGKIARQLDVIQRTLDVRFPVFILVTKSDMIYGFREFFETLDDPQLQHQILGWSNPTDRDTPFDPALVQQHLEQVRGRLLRRRMSLMLDPAHSQNPVDGRRIDEVDAMYAFPESLVKIGPRLRRYLEMIFVAGEWSSKPLFLRGIYFTSSMRKGDALDAELAEALGVGVEDLPEGKVFHEERAFFLRDLFLDKVFKEKGLVTKSVNTKGLQRRRRLVTLASWLLVVGSIIIMSGVSWWGFKGAVGKRADEWKQLHQVFDETYPTADGLAAIRAGAYAGRYPIALDARPPLVEYFAERSRLWNEEAVRTPRVFRATASVASLFNSKPPEPMRQEAVRSIFETRVLFPLVRQASERLGEIASNGSWMNRSAEASAALAQLVRINAAGTGGPDTRIRLEALFQVALVSPSSEYEEDRAKLQSAFDTLFADPDAWRGACERLRRDPIVVAASKDAMAEFVRTWDLRATPAGPELGALAGLRTALGEFAVAERDLHQLAETAAQADPADLAILGPGRSYSTNWAQRYGKVKDAYERAIPHAKFLGSHPTFAAAHAAAIEALKNEAKSSFGSIIESVPESSRGEGAGWTGKALADKLAEVTRRIDESVTPEVTAAIAAVDADQMVAIAPADRRAFQARFEEMYAPAHELMSRATPAVVPLADFMPLGKALGEAVDSARQRASDAPGAVLRALPLFKGAADASSVTLGVARRQQEYLLIKAVLDDRGRPDAIPIEDLVRQTAESTGEARELKVTMPLGHAGVIPSPKFAPIAAESIVGAWREIGMKTAVGPAAVLDAASLGEIHRRNDRAVQVYVDSYYRYWSRDLIETNALGPVHAEAWKDYRAAFASVTVASFRDAIPEAQRVAEAALAAIEGMVPAGDPRVGAVRRYRTASARFAEEIEDDRFQRSLSRLRDGVSRLPESAPEARRQLLKMRPIDVAETFAGDLYREPEAGDLSPLGQAYLNHLFLTALSQIDRDCQSDAKKNFELILQQGARFPITRDADPATGLTSREVRDLWVLVQDLRPVSAPAPAAAGAALPALELRLQQLGDAARLSDGSRKNWFDQAYRVLELLADKGEPAVTLYALPPLTIRDLDLPGNAAGNPLATRDFKYLRLTWRSPARNATRNFNMNVGEPFELARGFPLGAESLEVRIGEGESDLSDDMPANAKLALASLPRWTVLHALLVSGRWWAPETPVVGTPMWVVPMEMRAGSPDDPSRWFYAMGVKPASGLTQDDVKRWPDLELWRRASEAK